MRRGSHSSSMSTRARTTGTCIAPTLSSTTLRGGSSVAVSGRIDPKDPGRFADGKILDEADRPRQIVDGVDHDAEALPVGAHRGDDDEVRAGVPRIGREGRGARSRWAAASRASRRAPDACCGSPPVSSYSIGIMAREVRTCGVASCTWAITTSRSGSDFQTQASTRPAAFFITKGAAWLMLQARNPFPWRSVRPIARLAWVSSIRIATLRWRRPANPRESVTGTQSIESSVGLQSGHATSLSERGRPSPSLALVRAVIEEQAAMRGGRTGRRLDQASSLSADQRRSIARCLRAIVARALERVHVDRARCVRR